MDELGTGGSSAQNPKSCSHLKYDLLVHKNELNLIVDAPPGKPRRAAAVHERALLVHERLARERGRVVGLALARGGTFIRRPSPLNVLKDAYEHSCH